MALLALPGYLVVTVLMVMAFLAGVALAVAVTWTRGRFMSLDEGDPSLELAPHSPKMGRVPEAGGVQDAASATLIATALRGPLRVLRSSDTAPEVVEQIEHVAWQARMLAARPRPMQATPTSPITLLQKAAEEVELLCLGKVSISWGLMTRQPVHLDPERARAALRELLSACAEAAGEGARLAVRVHEGERERFPVRIEIEIGRRWAEPDSLPYRVARHLLEGQGAEVLLDGSLVQVDLRSIPLEAD